MKKIITALFMIFLLQTGFSAVNALQIDDKPEPGAKSECRWVNLRQTERDAKIRYYKGMLFGNGLATSIDKETFKKEYRGRMLDIRNDKNYKLLADNVNETYDNFIEGYYKEYTDANVLQEYAIQPKNDVLHIFYYNADGTLAHMNDILGPYPNFPYVSRQYNKNGKLTRITYFDSKDTRYIYDGKGHFKGHWYKGELYNKWGCKAVL